MGAWRGVSARGLGRFMPRVEIVQKHNTAARRLYIRGHNGKIYPYLVMNDACLTESRREERVLQLLRLLNPCLEKRKETTKRHLFFTGTCTAATRYALLAPLGTPWWCLRVCTQPPLGTPWWRTAPAGHAPDQHPPGEAGPDRAHSCLHSPMSLPKLW